MKFFVAIVFVGWLALAAMSARIFREPIEADLTSQARSALDERGLQVVGVEFDHLDATLTGNVPNEELKKSAERAVEEISGARVTSNQITFGRDISPRLVFVAGSPVKVSGILDVDSVLPGVEGFDLGEVARAECSSMSWEQSIGAFAKQFFGDTNLGRIELDGRIVTLAGEVANESRRWSLVDEAEGMAPDLDVINELSLIKSKPFEVEGRQDGSQYRFSGRLRDAGLKDRFASAVDGGDASDLAVDPASTTAPWFVDFPTTIQPTLDRAIDVSFQLKPAALTVDATFENEFWKAMAEQSLRKALPPGIEVTVDYRVAQKAVAADAPAEGERVPLPIKIMIAGEEMRVEGRVRLKGERDRLLATLGRARPDLKINASMKYDWREPKVDSLRAAYPSFLVYVISRIDGYGSLELHQDRWEVDVASSDPHLKYWLDSVASYSRWIAGIPCSVRVTNYAEEPREEVTKTFDAYPVYFKPLSAQISSNQSSKVEALASLLGAGESSVKLVIVGFDRGDGNLALQRARSVRRALVKSGVPAERFSLRAERVSGTPGWKREKVIVEIQSAPPEEEA